jgi:hypothetical protein
MPNNPSVRRSITRAQKCARSRVSNGKDLLPNIDGRTFIARRYRDITRAVLLDQGGIETISEARAQLARRFAAASVLAEQLEARLVKGEEINIAEHALLVSSAVRIARQIGVNRIARDISPSLGALLRADQLQPEPD